MSKFVPCVRVELCNFTGEAIDSDIVVVNDVDELSDNERVLIRRAANKLMEFIDAGDTVRFVASETEVK